MARRFTAVPLAIVALLLTLLAVPLHAEDGCVPIDDFATAELGEFPTGWRVRKDAAKAIYRVAEEGGRRFIHAVARDQGIQAAKAFEAWDLTKYPVLAWSWRPVEFPRGANEQRGKNDSVLAVYLLVPYSQIRGPEAVKYVWSEAVPAGTRLASNGGLTQVRVLESGTEKRGQWIDERVNVRDDYLAYFGKKAVPQPAGIAILTDSDDTGTTAQGDYANFRACVR
jgi:hypothetical protein